MRAHAQNIHPFLLKMLLTRVGQLRRDLAKYCTLYSQYQLQGTVTPYCDILCTTYRNRE
jgi:hypothetical protein